MLASSKQRRAARPWSKEEDALLERAIEERSESNRGGVDWHAIASHVPGRNNKDCRKRWVYVLGRNIRKGSWSPEEDAALREGLRKHGTKWSLVSQVVGTRQADQCSRRWREVLNPDINHDKWTAMEDEVLKNAVRHHGCKWTEIVDRYFVGRTPISAKTRYAQLLRQFKEEGGHESLSREGSLSGAADDILTSDSSKTPSISPSPPNTLAAQQFVQNWQGHLPSQSCKLPQHSEVSSVKPLPSYPHAPFWSLSSNQFHEHPNVYSNRNFGDSPYAHGDTAYSTPTMAFGLGEEYGQSMQSSCSLAHPLYASHGHPTFWMPGSSGQ